MRDISYMAKLAELEAGYGSLGRMGIYELDRSIQRCPRPRWSGDKR